MADNDVQIDLKKRARRRLVGAVALALLAAIVLPMVMDNGPKPPSSELTIRIPSQEGGNFASRLITGTAPAPASPVLPAQSPVVVPPPSSEVPALVQNSVQSQPVATPSVPQLPDPAQSAVSRADKDRAEEQRARDLLEGKTASPAGKFYVQLGVYREEKNARDLSSRAAAQGVKVSLEKLKDNTTRVRSGPYAERAAADKTLEKLKKAGIEARVVSSK